MNNKPVVVHAFTNRAQGKANVLQSQIFISEAYDPRTGEIAPEKKGYVAIWDTGATGSVLAPHVIRDLNITPSGKCTITGVGGAESKNENEVNTYLVNLFLPNGVQIIGSRVSEADLGGADVLIGMDVIGFGDFAVTNFNNKTAFSFRTPSVSEIDFVKEINQQKTRFQDRTSPDEAKRKKNREKRRNKKH